MTRRSIFMVLSFSLLAGCADEDPTAVAVPPATMSPAMFIPWDGGPVRDYTNIEDVPTAWRIPAIHLRAAHVRWSGRRAESIGDMLYTGNRASITLTLEITGPTNPPTSVNKKPVSHIDPLHSSRLTHFHRQFAPSICGHAVNLTAGFEAKSVFALLMNPNSRYYFQFLPPARDQIQDFHYQDPCEPCEPGGRPPRVTSDQYDPYAHQQGCDGGGGGGSGGSGIQYQPGDYTGGENVSWTSGIGIGGDSSCGAEARVEYICIDYWNGSEWVNWGCGFVTTCG